jgi:hypothetical protein
MSAGSGIDPATGEWAPAFPGQRPPLETGHTLTLKSGFWAAPRLRPDDRAEVEELVVRSWELLPFRRPEFELAVEQLACRIWRQRRAYADLAERGIVRDGKPAPILADLGKLENTIQRDLETLGLTPRSAASLGADLVRTEESLVVSLQRQAREREKAAGT